MKKLFTFGGLLALAIMLAACGSSGGSNGGGSAAVAPSGGGTKTVSVANVGGTGRVLVDSHGNALYASDQETAAGMVLCTGSCTSFWKPLTVSGAPKGGPVAASLGVMKRPDGSHQVTYNGKLLYTFTQDGPGEVTGDGVRDAFNGQHFTWHVVTAGNATGSAGSTGGSGGRSGGYGY